MKHAIVVNCLAANIYEKMSETSEIVDRVDALTELKVPEDLVLEDYVPVRTKYGVHYEPVSSDFVRVQTNYGVSGYINKKFIVISDGETAKEGSR